MKEYVFTIGEDRNIIIEANDEKEALFHLVEEHWSIIDLYGSILLQGEIVEKTKVKWNDE